MYDIDVAPFGLEIFRHKPAMAVLGRRLATQQYSRCREQGSVDVLIHLALVHEPQEVAGIVVPACAVFLVISQNLLSGGEQRFMEIVRAAYLFQEEWEVGAFGENCELGGVVEANVYERLDAGVS